VYAYAEGGPLEASDPSGMKAGTVECTYGSAWDCDVGGGGRGPLDQPEVYLDGVPLGAEWLSIVSSFAAGALIPVTNAPILTQVERNAMLIAYYNAAGAFDAAIAGLYVPKAGSTEDFVIPSKDYFIDQSGSYKVTAKYTAENLYHTVYNQRTLAVNVWQTQPWGVVRFFLNLDPTAVSLPGVAWYAGKIELVDSNHRWFNVDMRVYYGRWATMYVGLEVPGLGPPP
jgi:hypothetical protein